MSNQKTFIFVFRHFWENLTWRIKATTKEQALKELAETVSNPDEFDLIVVK